MTLPLINLRGIPGGDSYIEQTGMLVGNFEFRDLGGLK